MPIKRIDAESGAVLYIQTEEEKEMSELKKELAEMKALVQQLVQKESE